MRDKDGPRPIPFLCRHGFHHWLDPIAARWGDNRCKNCGVSDPNLMHERNGEFDHAAWARMDLYQLRNQPTAT